VTEMTLAQKIAVGFLGLFILGAVSSITQTLDPKAQQAKAESIARNQRIAEVNQKAREERIAELTGTKCTKNGKAMIGESPERTRKCGWGKPERINRSIYASHTREQWVYGGNNYLYFENDVLVSISN